MARRALKVRMAKEEKERREAAETAEALAALPDDVLIMYTDGGADNNGVGGIDGASGWGVSIKEKGDGGRIVGEMWGPVVTDETDAFFCRCQRGTRVTRAAGPSHGNTASELRACQRALIRRGQRPRGRACAVGQTAAGIRASESGRERRRSGH